VLSPYPCILKASILIIKNYHYEFAACHGIIQRNANKITAAETRIMSDRQDAFFWHDCTRHVFAGHVIANAHFLSQAPNQHFSNY